MKVKKLDPEMHLHIFVLWDLQSRFGISGKVNLVNGTYPDIKIKFHMSQ